MTPIVQRPAGGSHHSPSDNGRTDRRIDRAAPTTALPGTAGPPTEHENQ